MLDRFEGGCAPLAPMPDGPPSGNKKMKLSLAHEVRARAMARALLRGATARLRRREAQELSQSNAGEGTVRAWG